MVCKIMSLFQADIPAIIITYFSETVHSQIAAFDKIWGECYQCITMDLQRVSGNLIVIQVCLLYYVCSIRMRMADDKLTAMAAIGKHKAQVPCHEHFYCKRKEWQRSCVEYSDENEGGVNFTVCQNNQKCCHSNSGWIECTFSVQRHTCGFPQIYSIYYNTITTVRIEAKKRGNTNQSLTKIKSNQMFMPAKWIEANTEPMVERKKKLFISPFFISPIFGFFLLEFMQSFSIITLVHKHRLQSIV